MLPALPPGWVGPIFALLAAVGWGGGDFAGGMAVKSVEGTISGALRVVIAAHAVSLAFLLVCVALALGTVPHGPPLAWGLAAGVSAGLSLTAFYLALAGGAMGGSAAASGLLAAAIPAVVGVWLDGRPSRLRLAGFVVAALAIWLIAAPDAAHDNPSHSLAHSPVGASRRPYRTAWLAIGSGLGFGFYFVALRLANPLGVLEPMTLARVGSLLTCLALLACLRLRARPHAEPSAAIVKREDSAPWLSRTALGWALGVAVLDTGSNLLFIAATREGRLDVAAVLASLYPASTILLAAGVLHERPGRRQLAGMAVALGAVVMISL